MRGTTAEKATYLWEVRKGLRSDNGLIIEQEEIEIKVAEWQVRYHNFKELLAWPGVSFDPITNKVRARNIVWNEIAQVKCNDN